MAYQNTVSTSPMNTSHAITLGRHLLAARLGLSGYQPALQTLHTLIAAEGVSLVQEGKDQVIRVTASTHESLDAAFENRQAIETVMKTRRAHRGTVGSVASGQARLWFFPLGQTNHHTLTIVATMKPDAPTDELHSIGKQLSQCWDIDDTNIKNDPQAMPEPLAPDILGPDNPYDLTRAERQVCELLRTGTRPKAIASQIGVSISTIRTHLARIYSKTGLCGMVEVIHLLSQPAQPTISGIKDAA